MTTDLKSRQIIHDANGRRKAEDQSPCGTEAVLHGAEGAVIPLILVDTMELALVDHVQNIQNRAVE